MHIRNPRGYKSKYDMVIERLTLHNFKNYEFLDMSVAQGFHCFFGHNGAGKTNLLDSIYYLCMTKSYFGLNDMAVVRKGTDAMRLAATVRRDGQEERFVARVAPRKLKVFERQEVPYERLAEHIGILPVVMIAPDDTELLTDGSEARRRFLDNTLSQMDGRYLMELMRYNRILQQRNALLRQMSEHHTRDSGLIEAYTQPLIAAARYLFECRSRFMGAFSEIFHQKYQAISRTAERATLAYRSALQQQDIGDLLKQTLEKDLLLLRTTEGIHRDDLECLIEEVPVRRFASQGQRKSFLIALKLAQYEILRSAKGFSPILLLDDLYDKLDPDRVAQLFQLLHAPDMGQVFLTDTQGARIAPMLLEQGRACSFFQIFKEGHTAFATQISHYEKRQ